MTAEGRDESVEAVPSLAPLSGQAAGRCYKREV
jgi:hypothetical protein